MASPLKCFAPRIVVAWLVAIATGCMGSAAPDPVAGEVSAAVSSLPAVTSQPETVMLAGSTDTAVFTATADGSPAPSVQWQYAASRNGPWADISGATSTTLTVTAVPQLGYQFSLGNAFRAVFTNSAGTATSRPAKLVWRTQWMRDLGDDIASVPLNQLTIPGAHDMGTYGIHDDSDTSVDGQLPDLACDTAHDACVRFGEAQNPSANATAELNQGIRYFDLRVCGYGGNDFVTCHALNAAPLRDILNQTRDWVDQHPYEVVILDLNHHYELDLEAEADLIEETFADGTDSLLIPPRYCNDGDNTSGTCADALSLSSVATTRGRVIVNFENDNAPNTRVYIFATAGFTPEECAALGLAAGIAGELQDANGCYHYAQPIFGNAFYDAHFRFWGRADAQPTPFSFSNESCTRSGAVLSCFGNDSSSVTVLGRVITGLANIGYSHDFYVQFLQTTPDGGFIANNPFSSLDEMARGSNPTIVPALFECDTNKKECLPSEFRPENINILPINFYNDIYPNSYGQISQAEANSCAPNGTGCPLTAAEVATIFCFFGFCNYYDPIPVDYVQEIIRFDEYARTPPVVQVGGSVNPAQTGWYNAASLGGQGNKLHVDVTASDYRYATGISALSCADNADAAKSLNPGSSAASVTGGMDLGDGTHALKCSATDGATKGMVGAGNSGAGPGSTPQPVAFKVDTTPPTIRCSNPVFILHQPVATVQGTVTDDTSGPAVSGLSATASTSTVGTFSVPFTAFDVAGNSTTAACSYQVTYGVALLYDATMRWSSGSAVPIRVELVDYFGVNLTSKTIPLTATSVTNTTTSGVFAPTANGKPTAPFSFVATTQLYIYALATTGYAAGSYTLDFVAAGDPITHHAPVLVGKK